MATSDHITEAEMKSFCAGSIPARTTILCAEHLESCAECSRLFAGVARTGNYYRPFKLQIPKADELEIEPDDLADEDFDFPAELRETSSADFLAPAFRQKGWWERFTSLLWGKWRPRLIPLTAATAAIIALIILAWFIYQRRNVASTRQFQAGPAQTATPQTIERAPERDSSPIKDEQARATPHPATGKLRQPGVRPALTAALFDRGRKIGLDSAGQPFGIEDQPLELRGDMATALRGGKIEHSPALDEVTNADINQRGNGASDDELMLLKPVETLIKEDRPVLKWRPMAEATGYVVKVVDDSFNLVAESPMINNSEWQGDQPLKRDTAYIWQVTAYRNDEAIEHNSDRIARFKVISPRKLEEVEATGGRLESHLALAIFYAREGLLDEAEKALEKLFEDPLNAAQAEKIYRAVLPQRIRTTK